MKLLHVLIALIVSGLASGCIVETAPQEPEAVVDILVLLLTDPDPLVRRNAAIAMGRIRLPSAIQPLVHRLGDQDASVRTYSAWALGELGEVARDHAAVPVAELVHDSAASVKYAAALALGAIGGTPAVVGVLVEALQQGDAGTRHAVVLALAGLEARNAYPALVDALDDDDGRVRQGALAALGELADVRSLPSIRHRLFADSAEGVRSEAAYRLGKLGEAGDAVRLAEAAGGDRSPVVRPWARWAADELRRPGGSE